jgi:hypothetical protein
MCQSSHISTTYTTNTTPIDLNKCEGSPRRATLGMATLVMEQMAIVVRANLQFGGCVRVDSNGTDGDSG